MSRLFAVLMFLPVSLVANPLNETKGKPLDLPDIAAIMQTAFKVVGSSMSPYQYMSMLDRTKKLAQAGLDPSVARSEEVSGLIKKRGTLPTGE